MRQLHHLHLYLPTSLPGLWKSLLPAMRKNRDGGDDGGKEVYGVFGKKIQPQIHREGRRCGLLWLEVLNCGEAGGAQVGGERASPKRREKVRRWRNQLHKHDVGKSEPMGTHHHQRGCFHHLQLSFRRHVVPGPVPSFSGSPPPFTLLAFYLFLPHHPFFRSQFLFRFPSFHLLFSVPLIS